MILITLTGCVCCSCVGFSAGGGSIQYRGWDFPLRAQVSLPLAQSLGLVQAWDNRKGLGVSNEHIESWGFPGHLVAIQDISLSMKKMLYGVKE